MNTKIKFKIKLEDNGKNIHRLSALHFVWCLSPPFSPPLSLSLSLRLSLFSLFKRVCAAAHTDAVVNRCANGIKGTIH